METWDLWFPQAGASGLPFARSRIDPAEVVLVHAAPRSLSIEVRSEAGGRVAYGDRLSRDGAYYPMTRVHRHGDTLVREDGWPEAADIGRTVILAGGEAGTLMAWWNAQDGSEWRWSVEFYNHR